LLLPRWRGGPKMLAMEYPLPTPPRKGEGIY
jgi:hypothetical protein